MLLERLHAVARVHVQVALGLDHRATRSSCQYPNRQLVCQSARGHEDCSFFAQNARKLELQLVHEPAEDIIVRRDAPFVDETRQEARILRGRQAQAVAGQEHFAVVGFARGACRLRRKRELWPAGAEGAAEGSQLDEPAPVDDRHEITPDPTSRSQSERLSF
jgi:hypothetical protein